MNRLCWPIGLSLILLGSGIADAEGSSQSSDLRAAPAPIQKQYVRLIDALEMKDMGEAGQVLAPGFTCKTALGGTQTVRQWKLSTAAYLRRSRDVTVRYRLTSASAGGNAVMIDALRTIKSGAESLQQKLKDTWKRTGAVWLLASTRVISETKAVTSDAANGGATPPPPAPVVSAPIAPSGPPMTLDEFVTKLKKIVARAGYELHCIEKTGHEDKPDYYDFVSMDSAELDDNEIKITTKETTRDRSDQYITGSTWIFTSVRASSVEPDRIQQATQDDKLVKTSQASGLTFLTDPRGEAPVYKVEILGPFRVTMDQTTEHVGDNPSTVHSVARSGVIYLYYQTKEDAQDLVDLITRWATQNRR